jgi:RHS repeat-associated protein
LSQELCEHNSLNNLKRRFVYGNYIDEPLLMNDGANDYYYAQDHLYSTAALLDNTGAVVERYEYDAYGQPYVLDYDFSNDADGISDVENPYLFTGRRIDVLDNGNLELMYYRARYYSQAIGRFLSQDPIGYYDSMNLYEYVSSNPVSYVDATGTYDSRDISQNLRDWYWGKWYPERTSEEALEEAREEALEKMKKWIINNSGVKEKDCWSIPIYQKNCCKYCYTYTTLEDCAEQTETSHWKVTEKIEKLSERADWNERRGSAEAPMFINTSSKPKTYPIYVGPELDIYEGGEIIARGDLGWNDRWITVIVIEHFWGTVWLVQDFDVGNAEVEIKCLKIEERLCITKNNRLKRHLGDVTDDAFFFGKAAFKESLGPSRRAPVVESEMLAYTIP